MSNLKKILFVAMAAAIMTVFGACEGTLMLRLAMPEDIAYAEGVITWTGPETNFGYSVKVDGVVYESLVNSYSIELGNGNHSISVKSRGDGSLYSDSSWAPALLVTIGEVLLTPTYLAYDNEALTWSAVDGAEEYLVKINARTFTVTTSSYPTVLVSGYYSITVKALTTADGKGNSDWSEPLVFTIP